MATTPKANFISKLVSVKNKTASGLQSVGKNIAANEEQGTQNFSTGKANYYATINPLKGSIAAFKSGYGK